MDLSILLPVSGPSENVRACLESLARTLPRRSRCEVILTADAGIAATVPHRVARHDGPPTRAARLNAAARAAAAPVFCLLDPGTTLLHGWLSPMWRLLRREPNVGCVGNVHREPYSGLIEHTGIVFDADGEPVPTGRNEAVLPRQSFARQPAVSAACLLVRRDLFERLGGFDERYRSARFDDVDFCLRATEMGRQHFVANRSVIYHHATAAPPDAADLAFYRERWGNRARIYHREKTARLRENTFSPERWEAGREARRQRRQDLIDARKDGRRYLGKHLLRPWRYNYGRICRALAQTLHPLPAEIPRPPAYLPEEGSAERRGDAWLFDPPRR